MHGKLLSNGEFDYDWEKDGGAQLGQDVESSLRKKIKISIHMITKRDQPCYHAGVDTIDGFCFSSKKKLTEE